MKAVGIIAEYNPLHNGHIYHINQAKEIAGSDAVVIAMSGDFVQRGEPAILDKWTRSRHALMNGADLVIEIPAYYCLGNAGQYAFAGTSLLKSLGKVSHIAFGSESGDADPLIRTAVFLKMHKEEIEVQIRRMRGSGLNYPAARSKAYENLRTQYRSGSNDHDIRTELEILSGSNDILALEYILNAGDMIPVPVKRIGAGYKEVNIGGRKEELLYQSAAAVRAYVKKHRYEPAEIRDFALKYVPDCTAAELAEEKLTYPDDWLAVVKYACLSALPEDLDDCPSGGEGLGNLLRSAAAEACSYDDLIMRMKSRRYTYTRLSRLCMQAVLGIRRADFTDVSPDYIRVLGVNERGRRLLSEIRKEESAAVPVIININKEHLPEKNKGKKLLALDIHAADIYNLVTGRNISANTDHRMMPVIV